MNKKIIISFLSLLFFAAGFSQPRFSAATDLSIQHNFKKDQRYWAIGQTVAAHFHLTPKEGIYVWFSYYTNGKFRNSLVATARSGATQPQQINFVDSAWMRLKHFSVGWKKYLRGADDEENNWHLYAYAGFGLLLGRVENAYNVAIDTMLYDVPVKSGKANFKRLTIDLGIGWEHHIGGDFYLYTEGRVWIPTTDYPSKYIFVNKNAPFTAMLNVGIRTLF